MARPAGFSLCALEDFCCTCAVQCLGALPSPRRGVSRRRISPPFRPLPSALPFRTATVHGVCCRPSPPTAAYWRRAGRPRLGWAPTTAIFWLGLSNALSPFLRRCGWSHRFRVCTLLLYKHPAACSEFYFQQCNSFLSAGNGGVEKERRGAGRGRASSRLPEPAAAASF